MAASIRERASARGTRYQVVWRLGGVGARGQKTRSAGTFSTLLRAERVRDEVNERLARAIAPGYRSPDRARDVFVYIAELGGLYKIGISVDPLRRCRELQALLLHVEPGGCARERELHRRFRHLRERGEFFRRGSAGLIRRYVREYAEREYSVRRAQVLEALLSARETGR